MTEVTEDDEANDQPVDFLKVFHNVLCILAVIASAAMITVGFVYLERCSAGPAVPITLAAQGFITITLPIWFLLKYRIGLPIHVNIFQTVFITLSIFFTICLIACTRFVATSTCEDPSVYTIGIWCVVIMWISTLVVALAAAKALYPCKCREETDD